MRIVLLLVVLAVIGLTLARWLGVKPTASRIPPEAATSAAPAVPTRPQDLRIWPRTTSLDCACELRSFAG